MTTSVTTVAPVTKVTIVYTVAMATLTPWLPKLQLFIGCYGNTTVPEVLHSTYLSYLVNRLQNKILLLNRRKEMPTERSTSGVFMQAQQSVNNANLRNHGNKTI